MQNILGVLLVFGSAAFIISCGPNQRIMQSGNENPPANLFSGEVKPAVSSFEKDIESMRTAEYSYIFVYRRNDGAPLDAEDKAFLSANIPPEVNRRVLSDEGRAVIVGSNFLIPDDTKKKIALRFAVEDHSANPPANTNSNSVAASVPN